MKDIWIFLQTLSIYILPQYLHLDLCPSFQPSGYPPGTKCSTGVQDTSATYFEYSLLTLSFSFFFNKYHCRMNAKVHYSEMTQPNSRSSPKKQKQDWENNYLAIHINKRYHSYFLPLQFTRSLAFSLSYYSK